jgi:mRNA interferase RelE/StbE
MAFSAITPGVKTIRYLRDARIALRRHSNVADRLRRALTQYAEDPLAHANNVTQLVGETAKRMRVGDFRIIFEETDDEIIVTRIAPRGSGYL